jgi:hypothetical protein
VKPGDQVARFESNYVDDLRKQETAMKRQPGRTAGSTAIAKKLRNCPQNDRKTISFFGEISAFPRRLSKEVGRPQTTPNGFTGRATDHNNK